MKTIVINGGTGDLGSIVVPRLLRDYRCAILYRHRAAFEKLPKSDNLIGIADDGSVAELAPIYGVVMLAGGFGSGASKADFQKMFDMNLMSAVNTIDRVLPHLASPGRIVAVSSAASLAKPAGLGAYSASKTALNTYVETLSKDLKDRGITANALLPTALDTTGAKQTGSERLVKRENVAEMIALLLSDQASNVSGQLIAMSA